MHPGRYHRPKICGYNNIVHYQLTDLGLEQALDRFGETHDYLITTNADNAYHPDFFTKTLKTEKDIIATKFTTQINRIGEPKPISVAQIYAIHCALT